MNYKVSVIIPVYNAEENLETTIKSVINQTIGFKNIELILVDDNSSDNSKKIIESYSNQYNNIITYYSNENHGFPGFGRNVGLKLATSKYIMFLDNDDEYKEDICEKFYDTIIAEDADTVVCNKITVDAVSNIKQSLKYKKGIESKDKVIMKNDEILLFDSTAVWSKIFKKEIIDKHNIRFLENTHADDISFTLDYYLKINKLIYLKNYHGIYWKVYDDSLSHTVTKDHMKQLFDTYKYMFNRLKAENKTQYVNDIFEPKIAYALLQCTYLKLNKNEIKNILKDIRNFENEINFNIELNGKWTEIINKLILKKHYNLTIFLLKCIDALRKITFLRKVNRKL